jgi:D-alanyl-D-alanine carboxypeptidase
VLIAEVAPEPEPAEIIMTAEAIIPAEEDPQPTEVVTRFSTSGGSHWGINVGRFNSRDAAERALLQVALAEASALMGGVRRVSQGSGGFDANVVGLTRDAADLACRRLQARDVTCFMMGSD